jgi:non-ribosomal peptide synthetase component F
VSEVVSLYERFSRSADRFGDRPALEVGGETLSYTELRRQARALAATLLGVRGERPTPTTCVIASGTRSAFVGVLGAGASAHAYVPVQPAFPTARVLEVVARSEATEVIVDAAGAKHIPAILEAATRPLLVVSPEQAVDDMTVEGEHRLVGPHELAAQSVR